MIDDDLDDDSVGAASDPGPAPPASTEPPPAERYQRQGLLGTGGMGRVYAAFDSRLRRQVALKVAATPELAGRLAREAWITAQLEHPNIVAVYDAGETHGQVWYTMRMIRGRTLRERLAACPDLAARLALLPHLHTACQAVAYAHSMGIVHRDLKPSNLMVGEFGETQVADWGLAVPLDEARADWQRLVHRPGEVAGTPRYMSPEAAGGGPASPASDVFGLGAALYELLAGRAPPVGGALATAPLPPDVPPELAAIFRRSVQPDPAARYASAEQLADDLGRWLSGGRVRAHDYRPVELLVRLVRAWRWPLGVAAVAVVALVVLGAVGVRGIARERAVAEANLAVALSEQALTALLDERLPEAHVLAAHALQLGPSPEARGILAAVRPWGVQLVERIELPDSCRHNGVLSPDGGTLACPSADAVELWTVSPLSRRVVLPVPALGEPVWVGARVLLPTPDGLVWVDHDTVGARVPEGSWVARATGDVAYATRGPWARALSPDGTFVAFPICPSSPVAARVVGESLVVGCSDGVLRRYGRDGVVQTEAPLDAPPIWAAVRPSGDALLVGLLDGGVQVLDVMTGRATEPLRGMATGVVALQPVPGTPVVLVLGERGGPRLWNTAAGGWAGALPAGARRMLAGTRDGEVVLLGDALERWRIPAQPTPNVLSFPSGLSQVSPSPDGSAVAVALGDGTIVERRLADGMELRRWHWADAVAKCVAYADADHLIAGAMGEPGQFLGPDGAVAKFEHDNVLRRAGSLSGGRAWSLDYGGHVMVLGAPDGTVLQSLETHGGFDGGSSPDGKGAVVLDTRGDAWRFDGTDWKVARNDLGAVAVDIGDGGAPIVIARAREVCLDERCFPVDGDVTDVAISGDRVALATLSGDVVILQATTGERLAVLRGHTARVVSVEFGPHGDWLASASWDATVRLWDLTALDEPAEAAVARGEAAWGLSLDAARRTR